MIFTLTPDESGTEISQHPEFHGSDNQIQVTKCMQILFHHDPVA
jgi:hypothetical protein